MVKFITTPVIFSGKFHHISCRSCSSSPFVFIIFLRHQTSSFIIYQIRKFIRISRTWIIDRACRIYQCSGTSCQCCSSRGTCHLINGPGQRQVFGCQAHLRFDVFHTFIIRITLNFQIIIIGSIVKSIIWQ